MSFEPTPEQLQQMKERLQNLCEGLGIVYRERADDPCDGGITLTFTYAEEDVVDQLIRTARKSLASFGPEYWLNDSHPGAAQFRHTDQIQYRVWKCFLVAHHYWSVTFYLCDPSERYSLLEDSQ